MLDPGRDAPQVCAHDAGDVFPGCAPRGRPTAQDDACITWRPVDGWMDRGDRWPAVANLTLPFTSRILFDLAPYFHAARPHIHAHTYTNRQVGGGGEADDHEGELRKVSRDRPAGHLQDAAPRCRHGQGMGVRAAPCLSFFLFFLSAVDSEVSLQRRTHTSRDPLGMDMDIMTSDRWRSWRSWRWTPSTCRTRYVRVACRALGWSGVVGRMDARGMPPYPSTQVSSPLTKTNDRPTERTDRWTCGAWRRSGRA